MTDTRKLLCERLEGRAMLAADFASSASDVGVGYGGDFVSEQRLEIDGVPATIVREYENAFKEGRGEGFASASSSGSCASSLEWDSYIETQDAEHMLEADETLFEQDSAGRYQVIARAKAASNCAIPLYWSSSSGFIDVRSNGKVLVTDPEQADAYFASNDNYSLALYAWDGYNLISSLFVLNKGVFGNAQSLVWLKDSAGAVHTVDDMQAFVDLLEEIEDDGNTIDTLIIKGHGDQETIQVGDDGLLSVWNGDVTVGAIDGDTVYDITDVLNSITDANTTIELRGCFTHPLAKELDAALGGAPTTKGAQKFVLGIPGTIYGARSTYSY